MVAAVPSTASAVSLLCDTVSLTVYLLRAYHARRCASPVSAASCVGSAPRSNMTKHHPPPQPQPPPQSQPQPQPQPQTLQPPPPPPPQPQPPPPPLARPSRLQRCSPDRGTRRVAKEPRSPPPLSRGRVGPCRRCGVAAAGRHRSGHSSRHRLRCRPRSARCWRRTLTLTLILILTLILTLTLTPNPNPYP